jgi:hypothetical protein
VHCHRNSLTVTPWDGLGLSQFDHIVEEGSVVVDHAYRLGAEDIVSKRLDAP